MAKQPTFDVEDIERLFRALLPTARPDPFGNLEKLIVELTEDVQKGDVETDLFREKIFDELSSIKRRTFGILLLQIFRTIRLFMGLLPQGRIILLVVAALGLLQIGLETGELSGAAIREAVAKTGLANFIDQALAALREHTDQVANNVSQLADQTSQVFVSIAGRLEGVETSLAAVINDLRFAPLADLEGTRQQQLDQANALDVVLANILGPSNASSNAALILGPALRNIDDQIREFPAMALKLVSFS